MSWPGVCRHCWRGWLGFEKYNPKYEDMDLSSSPFIYFWNVYKILRFFILDNFFLKQTVINVVKEIELIGEALHVVVWVSGAPKDPVTVCDPEFIVQVGEPCSR